MQELREILKPIEELRTELNKMVESKELTDPEVVSVSQMLDALLNEYQKSMKDK